MNLYTCDIVFILGAIRWPNCLSEKTVRFISFWQLKKTAKNYCQKVQFKTWLQSCADHKKKKSDINVESMMLQCLHMEIWVIIMGHMSWPASPTSLTRNVTYQSQPFDIITREKWRSRALTNLYQNQRLNADTQMLQ